tara:strand:- start:890 stop:1720 length:831 start_codon:yes stop_codon:yes gene_type:complete
MKILIDNYSDYSNSQSLYLNEGFKNFGHESHVFDVASNSIFDVCDTINPDILIISANRITKGVIEYLQQSNLKLIINVDNLDLDNTKQLTSFLKEAKVGVAFLFTSEESFPKNVDGFNVVKVYHAADVNQIESLHFNYNVGKAIIIDKTHENIGYEGSFHVIGIGDKVKKENVDIFLPSISLRSLFPKYNEIIFKDLQKINQTFLNAICSGVPTYYDNEDSSKIQETLNKMLKEEFNINYRNENKITDFKNIASVVKENHTGNNRAKTILSQIKGA